MMILHSNGGHTIPRYIYSVSGTYLIWEQHSDYYNRFIDDVEGRDNAAHVIWNYTYRYFY